LIEQAVSAHRERNTWGRILASPAWLDLAPGERDAAFNHQLESRILEHRLDRQGWSSTVRAVLERIRKQR
jgi:hypothetical protein